MGRFLKLTLILAMTSTVLVTFQNCGGVQFDQVSNKLGSLGVCEGISCDLTPLTEKPAVTTILMALGDEANSQLVVAGASSQLIAETVVRYSSDKANPRILLVRDSNAGSEDPEDTHYVADVLLARYDVDYMEESSDGLSDSDLMGYDVVWFNNPGYAMGNSSSRDALLNFSGGVVLQGDDLSRGVNFDIHELTGIRYVDNGTSVVCNGNTYAHDNNLGYQYRVGLNPNKIPGVSHSTLQFLYGNDIDLTAPVRQDLEILATAIGGGPDCTEERPAIVRYLK